MGYRRFRVQAIVVAFLLVALLSCALAVVVPGKLTVLTPESRERKRIENRELEERLKAERPIHMATTVAWRVVYVGTVAGIVFVALLWGVRKAGTIGPNRQGIFPLIRLKVGRAQVVHDPNRTLTATTIYTTPELAESVSVIPVLASGSEGEQAQVTGRAQAVQALAALSSAQGTGSKAGELAGAVLGIDHQLTTKPIPPVKRSPWEPSHVERLLVESGVLEDEEYE